MSTPNKQNPKTARKAFSADVSLSVGDERTVVAKISTTAVDRDGEVLVAMGCAYRDFQANPVVMLQHSYWEPPVGKVVAIEKRDDAVIAKLQFAEKPANHPAGEEWLPDTLFSLYQQGVMNAFSVGFIPVEGRAANDRDIVKYGADCRYVHGKWKLLELSAVYLPCNQEAVALAVSKGLVTQGAADKLLKKSAEDDDAAAPDTAACSKCAKELPRDDMTADGDGYVCDDCGEDGGDDETKAAGEPGPRRVVASIELPDAAPAAMPVKHVRRVLSAPAAAAPDYAAVTRRLVVRQIGKMRGRIYPQD